MSQYWEALMAGDELLETWKRGNTEKERESQPHKKLTHSIEEILRRPTCVKTDTGAHRDWSVITENTRIWNQLSRGGTCFLKHDSNVNKETLVQEQKYDQSGALKSFITCQ